MTTSPTDPNQVRLTGKPDERILSRQDGALQTTRTSHWRVLLSPGGQGHVLFIKSDVANDEVRVYSDNIALARWLQEEIESFLFPEFADQTLPVVDAVFTRSGDVRSFWTESVESDEDSISLTWHDFLEPYMLVVPAGSVPGRTHGVYSCFVPARKAQLTVNGMVAQGEVSQEMRGDKPSTSACLAWSETWLRP